MQENKINLNELLITQVQERDEMIKSLVNDITKLNEAYIIRDKEKDKRHMKTIISVLSLSLITMIIIMGTFIYSYFWSNYNTSTAIYGNDNATSTINGNNNTNNQDKGGNK